MSTKSGSLALGNFLDLRGEEEVDSTCIIGILGHFRRYQRCRLESSDGEVEEI